MKLHQSRFPINLFTRGSDLLTSIRKVEKEGKGQIASGGSSDDKHGAGRERPFLQLPLGNAAAGDVAVVLGLMAVGKVKMMEMQMMMTGCDDSILAVVMIIIVTME